MCIQYFFNKQILITKSKKLEKINIIYTKYINYKFCKYNINIKNNKGETPIYAACNDGHLDLNLGCPQTFITTYFVVGIDRPRKKCW